MPSSPEPGAAEAEPARAASTQSEVEIDLEVSRQRFATWAVFGVVVGALLVWKLGTVGVWVGIALIVLGVYRTFQLVQTIRHEPGTIRVTASEVSLPRGLCVGKPIKATPSEITAVYFLRKSVPWHRTAPVLVIELGARALVFPRDWFSSEADQRHVVHALLKQRPSAAATEPAT